ncbi:response regulator transcription factor [Streptococcus gordonii]|uniref:response regulator transcription factor n=1 Tax=Streptococcus gordonii TaxID=1302 RepID=UPI001CBFF268|nr:response regulator transcription factor [Streptococcus gordonii]MBZ2132621.1 response regulator transcription factor [Streptococcus gordonii]MBZ2141028.1 response regulator transcription factor [Streptococcus gordonii]MBZ2143850.1 response regulator transcription factor [Streptococcus gordonii]MBZ2145779.1 response regulator transcription factor [Streptococcus gordonii]
MKLLLVEDEVDLNRSLTKLLKKEHFSVDSAFDGEEALEFIEMMDYDLIILDIMMPRMDGFAFLKKIRQAGQQVIVLVLTARDSLEDKIRGLNLGADDYLVKPFEFEELLARLRALLRRQQRELVSQKIDLGDLVLDLNKKIVLKDDQVLDLTAKEYEVLEYLARNRDHVLSREQIRDHVWDFDYEGESNIIDVLIKNIRRKIDQDKKQPIIHTKRGVGYVIWNSE